MEGGGKGSGLGEEGWAGGGGGVRFPADDVDVGVGVFWRTKVRSGCAQGAQLIVGIVVVLKGGDAGLAGGREGHVPGVVAVGEVVSGG